MDIYLFILGAMCIITAGTIVLIREISELKAKQTARIRAEMQRKRLERELREEEQEEAQVPAWVNHLAKLYGINLDRVLEGDVDALQEVLEKFVRR